MAKPESRKFYVLGGRGEDEQIYIKSIPQGGFLIVGQIIAGVEQQPIFAFDDASAYSILTPVGADAKVFQAVMAKAVAHRHKRG